MRLGILGGTFDPVHNGHLAFAEAARKACGLDRVWLMTACVPVYKRNQNVTSEDHRLAMCRLAAETNPYFEASDLEMKRGGDTYTADTLREVRAKLDPQDEIFFLVGADVALTVPKWRESDVVAKLAHIVVANRPGTTWPCGITSESLDGRFRVTLVDTPPLDISSTAIRDEIARGHDVYDLAPAAVCDYIVRNNLYR